MPRTALALGAIVALAFGLTACVAEPEAEPEWTEETAYAEAEEVFRAYIAAAGFEATNDDPMKYVTGTMKQVTAEAVESRDSNPIDSRGAAEIVSFEAQSFDSVGESVALDALACFDASTLEIRDTDGEWVQPRNEVRYGVEASFMTVHGALLIENFTEATPGSCDE